MICLMSKNIVSIICVVYYDAWCGSIYQVVNRLTGADDELILIADSEYKHRGKGVKNDPFAGIIVICRCYLLM